MAVAVGSRSLLGAAGSIYEALKPSSNEEYSKGLGDKLKRSDIIERKHIPKRQVAVGEG